MTQPPLRTSAQALYVVLFVWRVISVEQYGLKGTYHISDDAAESPSRAVACYDVGGDGGRPRQLDVELHGSSLVRNRDMVVPVNAGKESICEPPQKDVLEGRDTELDQPASEVGYDNESFNRCRNERVARRLMDLRGD